MAKPKTVKVDREMSALEVAEMRGCCKNLITRYCRQGRMKARKVGTQWIIHEADARAFTPNPRGQSFAAAAKSKAVKVPNRKRTAA